ncbi:hypothetical protein TIFTF001_021673 [Ficus carica]|uniref:Bifunctional inhibitor/plant lipid transfer protein/seed storage helical domain-containing protein n=1 Tax=Ficus carica TaxID=3494 RepID=A0AA88DEV2_FICCA|nr:hypothetical protein TIFTF001_021673 [Ficus carica]
MIKKLAETAAVAVAVAVAVAIAAALLLCQTPMVVAQVTCDPEQLNSCAGAILFNQVPSEKCCENVRQQQPCFCQYLKDPSYSSFINSDGAKRVVATCKVQFPTNCP